MKLQQLLTLLIAILLLTNCKGEHNDNVSIETSKKYDNKIEKKAYYLNYDLFMTYDIYLNDIKITSNYQSGPASGMEYLNEFILNSGTQSIRLVSKDLFSGETNLPDKIFDKMNIEIYQADENEENTAKVTTFDFPDVSTPKPYVFERTWTFEAKVPFI